MIWDGGCAGRAWSGNVVGSVGLRGDFVNQFSGGHRRKGESISIRGGGPWLLGVNGNGYG